MFHLWSDEDRWFLPRRFGLGYSFNFKQLARKLGWVKPLITSPVPEPKEMRSPETSRERLRRSVEASRYERPE